MAILTASPGPAQEQSFVGLRAGEELSPLASADFWKFPGPAASVAALPVQCLAVSGVVWLETPRVGSDVDGKAQFPVAITTA